MSATPPPRPRPGQVYDGGPDGPLLWVRREAGHEVFVAARERVVFTRQWPEDDLPAELELVHAPSECACGGRHYCHAEVEGHLAEIATLRNEETWKARERAALVEAMKLATSILPAEDAKRVRDAYSKALLA